jgi:tRNA nucleotidyltransferase (CCA-adding enzyme)
LRFHEKANYAQVESKWQPRIARKKNGPAVAKQQEHRFIKKRGQRKEKREMSY